MERNSETKTLSFSKGMTNIPSDLICEDSELLESDGFIYKDGSMVPIQKPVSIGNVPQKIMYVHKMADFENIIAYDGVSKIYWYILDTHDSIINPDDAKQSFEVGTVYDIKSVGNTLLVATSEGIHYLLYKGNKYKDLGTELPKPKVEFSTVANNMRIGGDAPCNLQEICEAKSGSAYYDKDGNFVGLEKNDETTDETFYYSYSPINDVEKVKTFQTAVQGHIAARIKQFKEKNYFGFPFFVRYALRLFDGSYARISNPILVCPTVNRNCYYVPVAYNKSTKVYDEGAYNDVLDGIVKLANFMFDYKPFFSSLWYKASVDGIEDWEDIVKEIVVFATDDVMPFDLNEDFEFRTPTSTNGSCYVNQVTGKPTDSPFAPPIDTAGSTTLEFNFYFNFNRSTYPARDVIMPKRIKSDSEIMDELLGKTQFYKLFTLDISESNLNQIGFKTAPIKTHTVENLTEQEQLKVDDYYGWTSKSARNMFPYNSRINLIGLNRKPFDGFSYFIPITANAVAYDNGEGLHFDDAKEYDVYTHIVSDSMDAWVKSSGYTALPEMLRSWLYYPDPNATEMRIVKSGTTQGISIKLKVHPMLNGAYYFGKLPFPRITQADFEYEEVEIPTIDENAHETMDSQIFTSVVNNPFVFEASGDNTVGTGKILGIVANTEAVSQGQFGQYPLLVFTTEGIYGMGVNSEGLYSNIYPISREVANDNSPFVPTDSLVFFSSKKGLMAASGGTVACVSEQLRGRIPLNFATLGDGKFIDFLKDCLIAYDYRDSMLRIFSKDKGYQYIYNMVDKTFSMVNSGITAQSVVNDYPDNLIQDTKGNVYSLTEKPDINKDTNFYSGTITTRPLKLGGSMTLKSLRDIKNLRSTQTGKLSLEVWGSNNAMNWCQLHSVGGKPWSYFTFRYTLTDFKACDSFQGSVVIIQNRRSLLRGQN